MTGTPIGSPHSGHYMHHYIQECHLFAEPVEMTQDECVITNRKINYRTPKCNSNIILSYSRRYPDHPELGKTKTR